uniref:Uncharacterized protein n=1 Tax=Cryptomonas curvata TaxID=233186 RepID=A0A7S0MK11_9CRYP
MEAVPTMNATRLTSVVMPTQDPSTAAFSICCSFLAVWIWQEGIDAAISLNGRICILVVFFIIWSLYETQKKQSILALPKHFDVVKHWTSHLSIESRISESW